MWGISRVFWRVFGVGKRRGDAAQTSFQKVKKLENGGKNGGKYKIPHMNLADRRTCASGKQSKTASNLPCKSAEWCRLCK